MKFIDHDIEFDQRKVIIVSTKEDFDTLRRSINWAEILKDSISFPKIDYRNIIPSLPISRFLQKTATGGYLSELKEPIYEMSVAKKLFQFPPHDPIVNTAYATAELFPNQYVQIANFHDYFRELKHASFVELCANLGAKEIYLEYAEINENSFSFESNSPIPTELGSLNLGISAGGTQKESNFGKLAFTFAKENSSIKEFSSPWLKFEPSWKNMVNLRENNSLTTCSADFNYSSDMGVNSALSLKLKSVGLNIGANFKELIKIKLKYKVIFWQV